MLWQYPVFCTACTTGGSLLGAKTFRRGVCAPRHTYPQHGIQPLSFALRFIRIKHLKDDGFAVETGCRVRGQESVDEQLSCGVVVPSEEKKRGHNNGVVSGLAAKRGWTCRLAVVLHEELGLVIIWALFDKDVADTVLRPSFLSSGLSNDATTMNVVRRRWQGWRSDGQMAEMGTSAKMFATFVRTLPLSSVSSLNLWSAHRS